MASIASHTIYSKTAKGLAEIRNKTGKLSRELTAILQAIDGKARFSELQAECGMSRPEMQRALEALALQGLIQEVATGIHQAAGANTADDDTAELDFSSPDATRETEEYSVHRRGRSTFAQATPRATSTAPMPLLVIELPNSSLLAWPYGSATSSVQAGLSVFTSYKLHR